MRSSFLMLFLMALLTLTTAYSSADEAKKENAGVTRPKASPATADVEIINLAVYPASLPRPVLKYRLLPTFLEMKPGNAALLYYRRFLNMRLVDERSPDSNQEKIDNWLNAPFKELPLEEAEKMLGMYPLREIDYATHRLECDWDMPIRESEEPFEIILDDMQMCRQCGRIIAMNARVQISRGNLPKALEYLQMGYVLARHEANAPFLVCTLIGNAIASTMNDQLFEFCQQKNAPNLYWTLTVLPRPFIDARRAIDFESVAVSMQFKELLAARAESHSAEQWQELWCSFVETHNRYVHVFGKSGGLPPIKNKFSKIDPQQMLKDKYAFVSEQLKTRGWTDNEIESKAPAHLMLLYCAELYDEVRDEELKWTGVPYSQLPADFMDRQKEYLRQFSEKEIVPLSNFTCVYYNLLTSQAKLEQSTAVLRTIEALRFHASANEGRLPPKLEDIKDLSVPLDPWTNTAIAYRIEGDTAVISVKLLVWQEGGPKWTSKEYHVKIAK